MPLNIEHIRRGKAVPHNWWGPLLNDFLSFVEEEEGSEILNKTGKYTFKNDYTYTDLQDQKEKPIQAGDSVRLWHGVT